MARETVHTMMVGLNVQINPEGFSEQPGPHRRYYQRRGERAEIVNVYMRDGSVVYDLLFEDGRIEEAMLSFGFTVLK